MYHGQQMHSMYGNKKMKIKRFIVQEAGTYNQQWKRPFESGMNSQTFNAIVDTVSKASDITPSTLTGLSNQFLHPKAQPESSILIPNGWGERRLRFFLEVETESQMNSLQTEYIVGYTDYMGMSPNGAIDPHMRFYINAINTTRHSYHLTGLGNQTYHNLVDSSHLLVNDQYSGIHTGNKLYSLRPEEIFTQINTASIQEEVGSNDIFDTQTQLTSIPIKSRRTNAIAPKYVSQILDSYLQVKRCNDDEESKGKMFETAKANIRSESLASDPFVSFVRMRGDQTGKSFTYSDLCQLDSTVIHNTVTLMMNHATKATVHQAGSTADWAAANAETVFATCLSQTIPGYMLDHSINKIEIYATNRDVSGQISITTPMVKSFMSGIDITLFVERFVYLIKTELLKDLSFNNSMDFAVNIRCDLLGETWINLSINSGPFIMYVTPSFCDSLLSPMSTSNITNLQGIASDFNSLMDQLGDIGNGYANLNYGFNLI